MRSLVNPRNGSLTKPSARPGAEWRNQNGLNVIIHACRTGSNPFTPDEDLINTPAHLNTYRGFIYKHSLCIATTHRHFPLL